MKKLLFLLLALCLLSGCAEQPASPDSVPPKEPFLEELPPDTDSVKAIYEEAAQIYDWFDLSSPPCTGDAVVADGLSYRQVDHEELKTYADLEAKVNSLFAPALAQEILDSSQNFRDIDGRLYCAEGGRGTNPLLFGKTIAVEQADQDHFTVELLFWTDQVETEDWLDASSFTTTTQVFTTGYSREVLNYERTDEGFRFTNFCSSDALNLAADTICRGNLAEAFESDGSDSYLNFTDWQLLCYLLHADGAFSEGPSDLLLHHFMERPQAVLRELALLYQSPFYDHEDYAHTKYIVFGPAYSAAAWLSPDEQKAFTAALDACMPENEAQAAVLEQLRSTYQEKLQENSR